MNMHCSNYLEIAYIYLDPVASIVTIDVKLDSTTEASRAV